jgi:protein-tyrosine phosphatase
VSCTHSSRENTPFTQSDGQTTMATDNQKPLAIRTSETHPLRIATLSVGDRGGAVGVTFAPGKHQAAAMTGVWRRDLAADLRTIREWGASDLITLLEPHEFEELNIQELPQTAPASGLRWHGLPITDGAAPDARFLGPWVSLGAEFAIALKAGAKVVVHCKGGLGRAGTVACLLLMATGTASDADDAMAKVRAVRHGAIETVAQEAFLRAWPIGSRRPG